MEHLPKICGRCGTRYDASSAFCIRDGAPLEAGEAPDPYLGQTLLGQFHLESRLGAGGMGTVYKARQLGVERPVAVKILHAELTQNADAIRRFQREARVSAALDHPNVVRVILFGQLPDQSLFLVMEFLDGRSLADVVHAEGALAPARAVHITLQVCDAIGEAHRQGVVHRDVKPENVQLVTRGRDPDFVKVLDFGIARFLWGEQTMVTQSGLIFGTARYISPEGAAGEVTDARSDVYSIGVLLFQLLCGETPFDAPAPVSLLMKHIRDPAPDVRSRGRGAGVPAPIAEVVARTLTKNPDARFDDARALSDALREAAAQAGLTAPLPSGAPSIAPPASHALRGGTRDAHASTPPFAPRSSLAPQRATHAASDVTNTGDEPSFDDSLQSAGLPQRRQRTRKRLLIAAFLTGALAVGGGAFVAKRWGGGESAAVDRSALARRARAAFDLGAWDDASPHRTAPGEDVLTLTHALLLAHPGDTDALRLRTAAALRLIADADQARGALRWDDARSLTPQRATHAASDVTNTRDEPSFDDSADIAGLPRRRQRTRKRLLIAAFLTGALAVGGGAFVAKRWGGGESAAVDRDTLARRARAAFDVGAWDDASPHRTAPGEDVLTLTHALLLAHPGDADALRLRTAAALRLVSDADQARGALRWDDARSLYQRALRLAPDAQSAREGLAIVDQHEHAAAPTAGVRTLPAVPRAGEAVTLVATLAAGTTLPPRAVPRFRVTRAGRTLRGEIRATPGDDGAWLGAFTFPQAGEYGVFFLVDDADSGLQLRTEVLVDARDAPRVTGRRRPGRDGDTPMILTHEQLAPVPPTVVVPPRTEDGIDWRVPPEPPSAPPDAPTTDTPATSPPPAPPAPWTGTL